MNLSEYKSVMYWNGQAIKFLPGESLSSALIRSGINYFGVSPSGQNRTLFCGIGQCQGCIVHVEGSGDVEACLFPCQQGLKLQSINQDGHVSGKNDEP